MIVSYPWRIQSWTEPATTFNSPLLPGFEGDMVPSTGTDTYDINSEKFAYKVGMLDHNQR